MGLIEYLKKEAKIRRPFLLKKGNLRRKTKWRTGRIAHTYLPQIATPAPAIAGSWAKAAEPGSSVGEKARIFS